MSEADDKAKLIAQLKRELQRFDPEFATLQDERDRFLEALRLIESYEATRYGNCRIEFQTLQALARRALATKPQLRVVR